MRCGSNGSGRRNNDCWSRKWRDWRDTISRSSNRNRALLVLTDRKLSGGLMVLLSKGKRTSWSLLVLEKGVLDGLVL